MKYSFLFFILISTFVSCGEQQEEKAISAFPIDTLQVENIPILEIEEIVYDYDTLAWTELVHLISDIEIDLRYATTDNFVNEIMYDCSRAFLRPKVAKALRNVQEELKEEGLSLKVFDAYRPRPIQQKLWDKVPDPHYVTRPWKGSMHNRGAAVDLTLLDENGQELDMGTPFDFFGKEAWITNEDLPSDVLANRKKLRSTMQKHGFKGIRTEWWHFSYEGSGAALSDWLWVCN